MTSVDNYITHKIFKPFGLSQGVFCCFILLIAALGISSCSPELNKTTAEEFKRTIRGEAQGTTYTITYYDLKERDFKPAVDSILNRVDESISTYKPGSVIDNWNKSDTGALVDDLFLEVLALSWRAYSASDGAFDPTVMPLVSFWGFGPERFEHPDSVNEEDIARLRSLVNFDSLKLETNSGDLFIEDIAHRDQFPSQLFLSKPDSNMKLDFNAVGQGWSVDKVAAFLEGNDVEVYFVEVGGEIAAGKPKPNGVLWRFGIDKPESNLENRSMQAIINLRNRGLATSGSYRKFYDKGGMRYSHTIDPKTGRPVEHSLLSATVLAPTAGEADAMATAFMVIGKDSTVALLKEKEYLSNYIYLIYDSAGALKTYVSPQVRSLIDEP